eukprot:TRINITY_DN707_c0_g1_i1.p1 TRINITY_DN707_c0_g1~~TRINITY_DN707_c0_g1_i1.p1  ORF type:complete len:157 (-),score=43.71 TRINITY_DN707_c0_g1_i1:15-437(-)
MATLTRKKQSNLTTPITKSFGDSNENLNELSIDDDENSYDSIDESYNAVMDFLAESEKRKVDSVLLVEESFDHLLEKIEKLKPYIENSDHQNVDEKDIKPKKGSSLLLKSIYIFCVIFTILCVILQFMRLFSSDRIIPRT